MQDSRLVSALLAGTAIVAVALSMPDTARAAPLPSLGQAPAGSPAEPATIRSLLEGAVVEPLIEPETPAASVGTDAARAVVVVAKAIADPAREIGQVQADRPAPKPANTRSRTGDAKGAKHAGNGHGRATARAAAGASEALSAGSRSGRARLQLDARGIAVFARESGDYLVHSLPASDRFDAATGALRAGATIQVLDPRAGSVRVARVPAAKPPADVAEAAPPVTMAAREAGAARLAGAGETPDADRADGLPAAASAVAVERRALADADPLAAGKPIVLADHMVNERMVKEKGQARHRGSGRAPQLASAAAAPGPLTATPSPEPSPRQAASPPKPSLSKAPERPGLPATPATATERPAAPPGLFLAFDPSSAAIDPQDLRDVAQRLADDAGLRVQLTGYATAGGALASGQEPPAGSAAAKLGVNRSLAVRARLVEQGVHVNRLVVTRPGQGADGVLAVLTRAA